MGRAWVTEAKEQEPSAGKVIATVFWDAKGVDYIGLFTQEKYNNWSVLCKLVRPAENRHP